MKIQEKYLLFQTRRNLFYHAELCEDLKQEANLCLWELCSKIDPLVFDVNLTFIKTFSKNLDRVISKLVYNDNRKGVFI